MIHSQCCLLDNLTNVIKNHLAEMFGTGRVSAHARTHSLGRQVLKMKFQLSYFSPMAFPRSIPPRIFSTVTDLLPDRDADIFSSSQGPSGRVLGSMWKPLGKGDGD